MQGLKIGFIIIVGLAFFFATCEKKEEQPPVVEEKAPVIQEKPAVCIWNKASLRNGPTSASKWLSSMNLGERVTYMGVSEIDSTDKKKERQYHKIRLSDGKEGWASEYVIAIDARSAVVTAEVTMHKRPDLVTFTDKKFQPMEFVAVLQSENEWLEVTGAEKKKSGWIKDGYVSYKDEDIALALLANQALQQDDTEAQKVRISELVKNPAFSNSVFIPELNKILIDSESVEEETEAMVEEDTVTPRLINRVMAILRHVCMVEGIDMKWRDIYDKKQRRIRELKEEEYEE